MIPTSYYTLLVLFNQAICRDDETVIMLYPKRKVHNCIWQICFDFNINAVSCKISTLLPSQFLNKQTHIHAHTHTHYNILYLLTRAKDIRILEHYLSWYISIKWECLYYIYRYYGEIKKNSCGCITTCLNKHLGVTRFSLDKTLKINCLFTYIL